MDPLLLGLVVGVATVVMLFSGIPIAFGLCFISVVFLVIAEGFSILNVFAETFYAGLNSFVLLSIPMFILMGMAVANSPAGKDLYTGLDRWLWRLPGGLVVSNIGACSIFAALSGSSPATCAAIGTMGIPEMRKRGYSARLATGCIAAGGTLGVFNTTQYCFNCLWISNWYFNRKIIFMRCHSRITFGWVIYVMGLHLFLFY